MQKSHSPIKRCVFTPFLKSVRVETRCNSRGSARHHLRAKQDLSSFPSSCVSLINAWILLFLEYKACLRSLFKTRKCAPLTMLIFQESNKLDNLTAVHSVNKLLHICALICIFPVPSHLWHKSLSSCPCKKIFVKSLLSRNKGRNRLVEGWFWGKWHVKGDIRQRDLFSKKVWTSVSRLTKNIDF